MVTWAPAALATDATSAPRKPAPTMTNRGPSTSVERRSRASARVRQHVHAGDPFGAGQSAWTHARRDHELVIGDRCAVRELDLLLMPAGA
jgi:hypothetical protein